MSEIQEPARLQKLDPRTFNSLECGGLAPLWFLQLVAAFGVDSLRTTVESRGAKPPRAKAAPGRRTPRSLLIAEAYGSICTRNKSARESHINSSVVHSLMKNNLMPQFLRLLGFTTLLLFVSGFAECYKPVTKNQLPEHIKTVAVPAFQNQALRYKIGSRFADAVINELIRRGRGLRVQGDRDGADAVIEGIIKSFNYSGVLLDNSGRARVFEVTIEAAVTVRDQTENRVLYDNQNFVFRGEYEFANDPRNFFNEEDPAVQRMARNFAESIVSTLTNAIQPGTK